MSFDTDQCTKFDSQYANISVLEQLINNEILNRPCLERGAIALAKLEQEGKINRANITASHAVTLAKCKLPVYRVLLALHEASILSTFIVCFICFVLVLLAKNLQKH